jgi:hypothetical protein
VKHHHRGFDAGGKFERLEGIPVGHFPFPRMFRGELIKVRGRVIDSHRERAKVVQAANANFTGFDRLQDPRHQADARAVTQFGVFKPQPADFPQHLPAVGVPVGIPTGGESVHI